MFLLVASVTLAAREKDVTVLALPDLIGVVYFRFVLFLMACISLLRKKFETTNTASPSLSLGTFFSVGVVLVDILRLVFLLVARIALRSIEDLITVLTFIMFMFEPKKSQNELCVMLLFGRVFGLFRGI